MRYEQELIRLLSRLTFSEADKDSANKILSEEIDWNEVFRLAIKNKILALCYYNLERLGYAGKIPHNYRKNVGFYKLGNTLRNEDLLNECKIVLKELSRNDVICAPLKGSYLVPYMYKDFGIRDMNDIDILIKVEDREKVTKIMNNLGYVQGEYKSSKKCIECFSREKILLWNMKMNNLPTFIKVSDSDYTIAYEFDFSFDLDLQLKKSPVNEILAHLVSKDGIDYLMPEAFFLHLCCHLYKEATNAEWVFESTDINFIKFCDVREYIHCEMDDYKLKQAVELARKYDLQKSIYFTIFYLREIYDDGYESSVLDFINIEDKDFLVHYNKRNSKDSIRWEKTLWDRLFSDTNKEELVKITGFNNKYSNYKNL